MLCEITAKEMYKFSLLVEKHAVDYIALYGHRYIALGLDKDGYIPSSMKVNGKRHNFKRSSRKILTDVIFNGNKSGIIIYGEGIPFLRRVSRIRKSLYIAKDYDNIIFTLKSTELNIILKLMDMEKKSKTL